MAIETIIMDKGSEETIGAGVKHRIIKGDDPRIEITDGDEEGFISYDTPTKYYCFSKPNIYRGSV